MAGKNNAEPHPGPARALTPARPLTPLLDWLVALLLSANLAWTALCLGGVRAETMVWTSALTLATAALAMLRDTWAGRPMQALRLSCLAVPFLLYAAASVLWISPVSWLGFREWMLWAQFALIFHMALGSLRHSGTRRLVFATLALLGAAAIILSSYQIGNDPAWLMLDRVQAQQYVGRASGFLGNPNSLAAFLILLIPPALALAWRRGASGVQRLACGYVALALMTGLVLTLSRGGAIAITLAFVAWPWFVREWPPPRRALACAGVLAVAALAALTLWSTLPSARERVETLLRDHGEKSRVVLWKASLQMTAGSPITGTGAGSFNTVFEKYRPEGFLNEPQWTHNEFLNLLGDHGIAGAALFFGALGAIAWRTRRKRPRTPRHALTDEAIANASFTRALGIALLGLALASMVDFHLRIPVLGMIAAIYAAEIVRRRAPAPPREAENRTIPRKTLRAAIATVAAVGVLGAAGVVFVQTYRAEAARVTAREQIDALANTPEKNAPLPAPVLECAEALLTRAIALDPGNAQAWADRSYARALRARIDAKNARLLGESAEADAREALRQSAAVFEFWLRLGVALDLQGRASEAGDAFAQALALAPANPLAWYHQAYHLALTPATRELALGALETCLRLDPGFLNADILRARLNSHR